MSETIAITGKSVKLFKGHYTRRVARSDETYQIDRRGASTAQRSYRAAQQVYLQALSEGMEGDAWRALERFCQRCRKCEQASR
ncbi:MAG: hypothetical protein ACREYE_18915 [Gammaproteobacteria bacterium]